MASSFLSLREVLIFRRVPWRHLQIRCGSVSCGQVILARNGHRLDAHSVYQPPQPLQTTGQGTQTIPSLQEEMLLHTEE